MGLSTIFNVFLSLIIFGIIIFVHELGHFISAKKCGVKVNEFSIGMGPKLFKKQKGETLYCLRLFPLGGFVSMEGEDEESDDENSFQKKPCWKRLIIVVSGALMNIVLGFVIIIVMLSGQERMASTTVAEFKENALTYQTGLREGDTILSVDGHKVFVANDLLYLVLRTQDGTVDMTVLRDGKETYLEDVTFKRLESEDSPVGKLEIDFYVKGIETNIGSVIGQSGNWFCYMARTVWLSLIDLITGRFGINEMSGPIGATAAITQAASMGVQQLLNMMAFISINVGIFNILPIPALDGGRLLFLLIELVTKRKVPEKYESYIHFAGFVLLMLLMVYLSFSDITRLIG